MIIIFLLINFVVSVCPSQQERARAQDGGNCHARKDDCCFNETYIDPETSNVTFINCCYTYGTGGTIKCCGSKDDMIIFMVTILSLFGAFIVLIIVWHYSYLLLKNKQKDNIQNSENLDDDRIINLEQ